MHDWDRSHSWIVHRCNYRQSRVVIHFVAETPSVSELMAVRRAIPEFRDTSPAALRSMIGSTGVLRTKTMNPNDVKSALRLALSQNLTATEEDMSYSELVPYDKTEDVDLVLDDKEEMRAVAEAMIAAGIKVKDLNF
ncbi:MAG: hypothetical protein IT428_24350 [Planctomycetaceae bacterium]|nr:hypothetical protein [Planctomycetaceae bacterium]